MSEGGRERASIGWVSEDRAGCMHGFLLYLLVPSILKRKSVE